MPNEADSDVSVFGCETENLTAWSLKVEAALVGVLDLLHTQLDQSAFDLLHIRVLSWMFEANAKSFLNLRNSHNEVNARLQHPSQRFRVSQTVIRAILDHR